MNKIIVIVTVLFFTTSSSMCGQDLPTWALRLGYSPGTEDNFGFGVAFRPTGSRWFHQAEAYLIQNRGSDATLDAKNFGGLIRSNYIINNPDRRLLFSVGPEVYAYQYTRRIVWSLDPDQIELDAVAQIMAQVGIDYRFGKRIHINLSLPVLGAELSSSSGSAGVSRNATPAILGFFGFFQPKLGIEVGVF